MLRTIVIASVSSLATAAFFISGLGAQLTGAAVAAAAGQAFPPQMFAALPPEVQGLGQLPPAQRFDHFAGVQARFTDVNNTAHTVSAVPGTAQSVTPDSLTITPNDPSLGASKTYKLSGDTIIRKSAAPWSGSQSSGQIAVGDKLVVVSIDGSPPRAVIVGTSDGMHPGRHWGPGALNQTP
jgi:hypothetical protein